MSEYMHSIYSGKNFNILNWRLVNILHVIVFMSIVCNRSILGNILNFVPWEVGSFFGGGGQPLFHQKQVRRD